MIAQNWLDLDAEHALSSFDQRHLLTAQVEYSGRGVPAGLDVHEPAFCGQRTAADAGLSHVARRNGSHGRNARQLYRGVRHDAPDGFYVNPAAFAAPAAGEWGTAARNSITGPAQFSLNAGVTRTFVLRDRWSMDWRLDATNVLNTRHLLEPDHHRRQPAIRPAEPRQRHAQAAVQPAGEVLMRAAALAIAVITVVSGVSRTMAGATTCLPR